MKGLAGQRMAVHGLVRHGNAGHGPAGRGKVTHATASRGFDSLGVSPGDAGHGTAVLGPAWFGWARCGVVRQGHPYTGLRRFDSAGMGRGIAGRGRAWHGAVRSGRERRGRVTRTPGDDGSTPSVRAVRQGGVGYGQAMRCREPRGQAGRCEARIPTQQATAVQLRRRGPRRGRAGSGYARRGVARMGGVWPGLAALG